MTDAERFEQGCELFNRGRFFEAHEAWERLWLQAHGARRLYLQGLIQIAAGCHKAYERGDRRGCAALVSAGLEKICRGGLVPELAEFSDRLDELIAWLRARETSEAELPRAPTLPGTRLAEGSRVTDATPEGLSSA